MGLLLVFVLGIVPEVALPVFRRWYDCSIIAATPFGFRVRFTDYKNEEDLPGDRVRAPRKAVPKKRTNDIITPGGYRIPQYLAAKPTGTNARVHTR